jgi:hypothetical protein
MADETVPIQAIRLRKSGVHTVVDAEIGGVLVEVIRERSDGEFCHIVESSGIFGRYYGMPQEKSRQTQAISSDGKPWKPS